MMAQETRLAVHGLTQEVQVGDKSETILRREQTDNANGSQSNQLLRTEKKEYGR
jgi:hypothetical protein